jgi:quercetin dioxygenase-like cupin family protein
MGSAQNATRNPQVKTQEDAYSLGPGEGDARWVMGELDTIKATAAQTGGLFGLKESKSAKGSGPPLHVHEHEDEACYVLEGEVTFFVGDDVVTASAGT